MKIVLDCERMKYPFTGLNTFCKQLAAAMRQTVEEKDQLSFFVAPKDDGFLGKDQTYIKQHFINKVIPVQIKDLDIWHSTYQLSKYTGGGRNTKKVLTVHDLNYLYEKSTAKDIERYRKKHQRILDRADHIVAISEYVKNDILHHLDVKGKPVSVVHNGFQVIEYPDFNTPTYSPQRPYIFAMGTVVRKKNFHVIPAILKDNDYELIIAGSVSDYAEVIKDEAKKYNVSDRVKIIGAVSDEEKYWYLKNMTSFVFPSLAEGFGLPVMEAMAFGKPVFLSTLTSLPEIGGEEAYYFENFDPDYMTDVFEKGMSDFNANHEKRIQIEKRACMFSWEKCAQGYYDIYTQLVRS